MAQSRLTELDAVNTILRALGRFPVNGLEAASLTPDARFALDELRYQSRLVQTLGWHFNRERSVKYLVDSNDEVILGDDIASVDNAKRGWGRNDVDLTMRQDTDGDMKLYDKNADARDDDPFKFPSFNDIRVDQIRLLDFESTPEAFRHYITIRAGRATQARLITDEKLYRFSLDDEGRALQVLAREEADTSGANALNEQRTAAIVRRMSPIDRLESM